MIESQGIFSLAARSEATLSLARNVQLAQSHVRSQVTAKTSVAVSAYQSSASLASGSASYLDLMTSTTISPAAKLKAFLKDVLDKTDDNLISDDMLKRLQQAQKSDNKEISAERLREAKAKLQALRMQAQMAVASGDPKQLRRIAQEAAQAAHEVAAAVRGLASGIAATALTADGSGSVPVAAAPLPQGDSAENAGTDAGNTSAQTADVQTAAAPQADGTDPAGDASSGDQTFTGSVPSGEDPIAWGRQALQKLSDDAHIAIAQARGLIAFLAAAARAARKHRPDPDEDKAYRDLERSVSDADADVNSAIADAGKEIADGTSDPGTGDASAGTVDSGGAIAVDTTAIAVQITTEVTVTTDVTV
jgi:hypothetical protein